MKIFITGGSGLIGQYVNVELAKQHEILTQYRKNPGNCTDYNSLKCKITDYTKLDETLSSFKPDVVIHTAAVSSSEKADQFARSVVYNENVNATKVIALLCKKHNTKLIYTSTDLVYSGFNGSFLKENAKIVAVSFYAKTKYIGEVKIRETFNNYIILRSALQYGFGLNHSTSHFQYTYEELKKGNSVKLFSNQFRSALSVKESARIIGELVTKDVAGEIINLGGTERVSRCDLGLQLCEAAGFDKSLIKPITMKEARVKYQVADVSMNVDKLANLGIKAKTVSEAIKEMIS